MKRRAQERRKGTRPLIQGLQPGHSVDRAAEEEFVFAGKAKADAAPPPAAAVSERQEGKGPTAKPVGRVPLTTRLRFDFATALKRASLQQ